MATTFQSLTHRLVAEAERVRGAWYARGKGRPYPPGLREAMTEAVARLRLLRGLLCPPPAASSFEKHPGGSVGLVKGGEGGMYSPRIREDLIPPLYRLAKARRVPMTRLVSDILAAALAGVQVEEATVVEPQVRKVKRTVYRVVEPTGDPPQQEG